MGFRDKVEYKQLDPEVRTWLTNAGTYGGSFVSCFAEACIMADDDNFKLLLPVLMALMAKYPNYLE